jgi:hypothetical protein
MLTTVDVVKAELGITDAAQDALLTTLIEQASGAITRFCNRPFSVQSATQTFRILPNECVTTLFLDRLPVTAITSVTADTLPVDAAGYDLDPETGAVMRLAGNCVTRWRASKVVIAYAAGVADVPPEVARCCIDLVKAAFYARDRDPMLRSDMTQDVGQQSWTVLAGASLGGLPKDIAERLLPHKTWSLA